MGCHTWTYKPLTKPTHSQMKSQLIEELSSNKYIKDKHPNTPLSECTNKQRNNKLTSMYLNRLLRHILTNKISHPSTILKLWIQRHTGIVIEFENELYINTEEYGDAFRIGKYPETTLTTELCTTRYTSTIQNVDQTRLTNFWKKHPNGIIKSG